MKIARFRSLPLVACLTAGLLCTTAKAAVPFVSDGSFEDPAETANSLNNVTGQSFDGWSGDAIGGASSGDNGEYLINGNIQDLGGNNYGVTPFGSQYLGLNAVYRNSFRSIESQTVNGLTPGQPYELTIYIANLDGANDPNISLTVEYNATSTGNPAASATFSAPAGEGPYGNGTIDFVPETLIFTPTSNTISFNIGNQSKTGTMGIDNVSLVAVPEPTTTAAALLGTAGLAVLALRRRRRTNQAA